MARQIIWVKKNPLPVGCAIGAVVLGVWAFIRSGSIPEAAADLERKSGEAQRYAMNLGNAAQLKEHYDSIVAANKGIEARLIHASQLGINQQYFYKLESEYAVKLTELHQNSRAAGKGYVIPVGFSVTAQGNFAAVVGFLQALEKGTHFCRVLSANCSGDRTGPVTLVLNVELLGQP